MCSLVQDPSLVIHSPSCNGHYEQIVDVLDVHLPTTSSAAKISSDREVKSNVLFEDKCSGR